MPTAFCLRVLLKLLVQRFRQVWPDVKLIIRGDSGFCRWRLMRWCDPNGIGYILGLARNRRLEALWEPWLHEAPARWQRCRQPQRLFASLHYAATS
jgi:hypothetical protein